MLDLSALGVAWAGVGIGCLALVYVVAKFEVASFRTPQLIAFIVLPAVVAAANVAALIVGREVRAVIALSFVAIGIATVGADIYIGYSTTTQRMMKDRFDGDANADTRTGTAVVQDLRQKGIDAFPAMLPSFYFGENSPRTPYPFHIEHEGRRLVPLSGISNVTTVMCNESGEWTVYRSDRMGFNNPANTWQRTEITLGVVGDSFAHGACVSPGADVASRIREKLPATLNVGMSGNGPLLALAAIKEHLAGLRPRVVAWLFFAGNDMENLAAESKNPILTQYMKPGFKQGLAASKDFIDGKMRDQAASVMAFSEKDHNQPVNWSALLRNSTRLINLRKALGIAASEPDFTPLKQVLKEAKREVASWDGRLLFVFLPDWPTYSGAHSYKHRRIVGVAAELGLTVIDGMDVLKQDGLDRTNVFARPHGHYSPRGYKALADAILVNISSIPTR